MNHRAIAAGLCGLALLFTATPGSSARVDFSVALTPPPAPGSVWTPGYWSWNGVSYVWVPGRYVVATFPDAVWIGGRWVARGHAWTWVDEHWRHR
jgi:WXXGXW repeat (2 copies)